MGEETDRQLSCPSGKTLDNVILEHNVSSFISNRWDDLVSHGLDVVPNRTQHRTDPVDGPGMNEC